MGLCHAGMMENIHDVRPKTAYCNQLKLELEVTDFIS